MTILIFAGGVGSRLWPLSRSGAPKQFVPLQDGKSTLQLAIDRVREFGLDNVYISTHASYAEAVAAQVPEMDTSHILAEPDRRDLTAAVGLALVRLRQRGVSGTVAILWSDHFMKHPDRFVAALRRAEGLVSAEPNRLIFFGETPRFPNHNLGWIRLGEAIEPDIHRFLGWKYRPDLSVCHDMHASGEWVWNPGYFVFDRDFLLERYREHVPEMYGELETMGDSDAAIAERYALLPAMHFDDAIVSKIPSSQAVVLKVDLGWSDPGTLYALKEALEPDREKNLSRGFAIFHTSKDSFIANHEEGKLVAGVGLDGMVVVNTPDVLLVCHKSAVPDVKELLERLKAEGHERYV